MIKWPSLALFFLNRNKPVTAAKPAKLIQGYVDDITPTRIVGWARNGLDPRECILVEFVLPFAGGERIIGRSWADKFYPPLSDSGFGDGKYGFDYIFQKPLQPEEQRRIFVRAKDTAAPLQRAHEFQGYVDQRSPQHVAGWARNRFDPQARVQVEAVLATPKGEKILARGLADRFYRGLAQQFVGDGLYGFFLLFSEILDETSCEQVIVRPVNQAAPLDLSPNLVKNFDLLSYAAMDIVNNCNLRCPFCLFDYADTNSTRFMTQDVFDAALRLAPLVADGSFWLSCLHEPSMHPKFLDFIGRVPRHLRRKLMFTTNLAKRMPASYFETLSESGVFHINVSIESLDPPVYEKFRKGARWPIFKENWDLMVAAWRAAPDPPKLRYVAMAYQSNFRGLPALVKYLLEERCAWQVEVRYTFDLDHIPENFRSTEYLHAADWHWLSEQLSGYSGEQLLLVPPSDLPVSTAALTSTPEIAASPSQILVASALAAQLPILPLNAQIKWDGAMVVCDKWEHPSEPTHIVARTNIRNLEHPLEFLQEIAATPTPDSIYGFIDEISPTSVTGWVRNFSKPAEPVQIDAVVRLGDEARVIAHGVATEHYLPLTFSGFDNLNYGFRLKFEIDLTQAECDQLEIRPSHSLGPLPRAPKYQGEVEERTETHVAGWLRHRFNASEQVVFEVAALAASGERVLGHGVANLYNAELAKTAPGNPDHGFRLDFESPLAESELETLVVRPANRRSIQLALSAKLVRKPAIA